MKKILSKNYLIYISILILYSISIIVMNRFPDYSNKHYVWLLISFLLLLIIPRFNLRKILKYHYLFYILSNFLLLLTLFTSKEIKGSRAWINLYFFSLQPSELMKVSLLITLSILTIKKVKIIYLIILTIIPSILTYLEPDTGAIIFYLIILVVFLSTYKLNKTIKYGLIIGSISLVFSGLYLFFYQKDLFIDIFGTSIFYRIDRLKSFMNYDNIQIENALIAISTHNYLYFPEAHNDFIFPLIVSTLPLIATMVLLICFNIILLTLNYKCLHYNKTVSLIYKILFWILFFQIFYNILMTIGLLPIMGIPLPFVSYGGSYIISLTLMLGIALNYERFNYRLK